MAEGARDYSWPPFEDGNTVALRHGARSPRVLQPMAQELATALAEAAPWTSSPAYAAEVQAWAWNEARCRVLRSWEHEHGILSDEGQQAASELHRAETRAATARTNLGLTPLALAKLITTMAGTNSEVFDDALEQLRAEGRRLVEARGTIEAAHADADPATSEGSAVSRMEPDEGRP